MGLASLNPFGMAENSPLSRQGGTYRNHPKPEIMNIVILAAGQGKRMNSGLPKVLHALAGKALLRHVLDTARALEPARVCIVVGHGGEAVRAAASSWEDAAALCWALQEPQLGTAHALQQALPFLDKNEAATLVLYGDVPLLRAQTLRQLLQAQGREALCVLTAKLPDPTGYGRIVRDRNGGIVRIVEEKDASQPERALCEINTGIMALPTARLPGWLARLSCDNAQAEYYLTDLVALAVADGVPVTSVSVDALWEAEGVNDQVQRAALERRWQRENAQALMRAGVHLADPERIDVRGELLCGRDVVIDLNCVFEGRVELGADVAIGPHCVLKNVRVAEGARIHAFSHLEDCAVGEGAIVGPYARLRPGAELGPQVHIGNFVEIKNSRVEAASKINHLSYIGDADIGSRVNIGAGTITCNYDGANKSRTVVGDDAFIGSNTLLVAPITVGSGATVGAGTTLTRDAPPEALTLSRAAQTTRIDWKRPVRKTKNS